VIDVILKKLGGLAPREAVDHAALDGDEIADDNLPFAKFRI
jgi:hypothetical protein